MPASTDFTDSADSSDPADDCYSCRENRASDLPVRADILRTPRWRVVHAFNSSLPGWLVVIPTRHVTAFAELTDDEAAEFGPIVRNVSHALERVVGCVKTYVMLYAEAEGFSHLHVHVVPRAADIPTDRKGPRVFGYLDGPVEERVRDDDADRLALAIRAQLAAGETA